MDHSSQPLNILPVNLKNIPFSRERHALQSTEFSFSRFLVPYLYGYRGLTLFMDCDVLCLGDIAELFKEYDYISAVQAL
jgi:lipopolysaccharide biosynthesis glycosyltransferase